MPPTTDLPCDHLTVSVRQWPDEATITLSGELDRASADLVTAAVDQALDGGCTRIAVDAVGVAFADTGGLRALLAAEQACAASGVRFGLVMGDAVRWTVAVSGLAPHFEGVTAG